MIETRIETPFAFQSLNPSVGYWGGYDEKIRTEKHSTYFFTHQGVWFVDPAQIADEDLTRFTTGKHRVAGIFLSNENHLRESQSLSDLLSVPLYAHEEARDFLGAQVHHWIRDGDQLPGDVKVIPLPGTTHGECALWIRRLGLLVMGDALTHLNDRLDVLPDKYVWKLPEARRALHRLSDLPVQIMTFAHGEPLVRAASDRLLTLIQNLK